MESETKSKVQKSQFKKIGYGCYSTVYTRNNKVFKIFNKTTPTSAIIRELCIISMIDHKNIVKIKTIGKMSTGLYFYTMDKYAPLDLYKFKDNNIFHFLTDILSGLAYLHAKGIMHRDLKESNILVDKSGYKICDFSISKLVIPGVTDTEKNTNTTKTTNIQTDVTITSTHRPPETYKYGICVLKSDIWSFACVLFYIATKKSVYDCFKDVNNYGNKSPVDAYGDLVMSEFFVSFFKLELFDNSLLSLDMTKGIWEICKKCLLPVDQRASAEDLLKHVSKMFSVPLHIPAEEKKAKYIYKHIPDKVIELINSIHLKNRIAFNYITNRIVEFTCNSCFDVDYGNEYAVIMVLVLYTSNLVIFDEYDEKTRFAIFCIIKHYYGIDDEV